MTSKNSNTPYLITDCLIDQINVPKISNSDSLTESFCQFIHPPISNCYLSYDVAVIQWITSSHKNGMTTCVITLWRIHLMSLMTSMSIMCFLIKIMIILKALKSHFKGSYDKQNLTLEVISYEIYETHQRLVS